jgi:hypothetical protein
MKSVSINMLYARFSLKIELQWYAVFTFRFSKKATKFETISHLIWHVLGKCQIKWEIISNFCGLFRMSELYNKYPFARKTPQLVCNFCLDSNFQLVVFIRFCPVDIQTKRNRLAVTIQSSCRHRLLFPLDTFAHIAPGLVRVLPDNSIKSIVIMPFRRY